MNQSMPTGAPVAPVAVSGGLLDGLTPEQRQAVLHGTGPLLIFAGPGAGKTRTITHRIAYLLASAQAIPTQILAVTFTVAAAGEMRERLAQMLGVEAIRGLTVATFHSVCARLLRAHAGAYGRGDDYTIYDQADMRKVVDHLLSDKDRTEIQHHLQHLGEAPAVEVLKEISLAKNRLWTPGHYAQHSQHSLAPLIAAVWSEAEEELKASNAFDFDDLLVYGVRMLAEFPALLAQYRQRWPWMLVDEFQDTNYAQMAMVSLLAGSNGNLTVVADDDQAIYAFRGSSCQENVLGFGNWFPGYESVTLGRNYRCRAEILTIAANAVAHNTARVPKALVAMRGPGARVDTPVFASDYQEAGWICSLVAGTLQAGIPAREVLIVARTAFAMRELQSQLAANGIPYRVLGALGLFERAEVKDALAYLSLLANPSDAQAFRRAVQAPRRGVGAATANAIVAYARDHGGDLVTACCHADTLPGIRSAKTRAAVREFGEALHARRSELAAGRSVSHVVVETVMMPGGLVRHHQAIRDNSDKTEARRDAEEVLEDLRSLCRAAGTYTEQHLGAATLQGFLEEACGLDGEPDQGDDAQESQERITLATIHRSKGKEAHLVVLVGAEERLLPSWRSLEDDAADTGGLEEERRLFYVAVTRAKDHLVITQAQQRGGRDTEGASRFLTEAGL